MRAGFVFPAASLEQKRARIESAAISDDELLSVTINEEPLYSGWEQTLLEGIRSALGEVPDWRVEIDYSYRVAEGEELRSVVLALLEDGGVGASDFGDHC